MTGVKNKSSVLKHIIVLKPPRQYSAPAEKHVCALTLFKAMTEDILFK